MTSKLRRACELRQTALHMNAMRGNAEAANESTQIVALLAAVPATADDRTLSAEIAARGIKLPNNI